MKLGKYMSLDDISIEGARTKIWLVHGRSGDFLGDIRWFPRWRQYAFYPHEGTLFNSGCLNDLYDFLVCENVKHKAKSTA